MTTRYSSNRESALQVPTMYAIFSGLKSYFNISDLKSVSYIFYLHTFITPFIFIAFDIFLAGNHVLGKPISCIPIGGIPEGFVNLHCWFSQTFIAVNLIQHVSPYPGIGPETVHSQRVYQAYYPWMPLISLIPMVLFFLPKYVWSWWEDKNFNTLASGLQCGTVISNDERRTKVSCIIDYRIMNASSLSKRAMQYWFCELLCMVIDAFLIYLIDFFLGGEFLTYGWNVFTFFLSEKRTDPMQFVFPHRTKCIFHKFGSSGTIEKLDTMCILPLNVYNEVFFALMWFWFAILLCLALLQSVYRALILLCPWVRCVILQRSNPSVTNKHSWPKLSRKMSIGTWWMLYQLSSTLDPYTYANVIEEMYPSENRV